MCGAQDITKGKQSISEKKKMKGNWKKYTKRIAFFMAIVFFLIGASPALLEADGCEAAYYRCVIDPFVIGHFLGSIYCITGYLFCKKYVEE
jgi:hypothetical protein